MVYTPGRFAENSPMSPSQSVTVKNKSTIKPIQYFLTHYESNLILMSLVFLRLNSESNEIWQYVVAHYTKATQI